MVTGHFLLLSYRFDNAIIDFLNSQGVTFKMMYDSIGLPKNLSYWLIWLTKGADKYRLVVAILAARGL